MFALTKHDKSILLHITSIYNFFGIFLTNFQYKSKRIIKSTTKDDFFLNDSLRICTVDSGQTFQIKDRKGVVDMTNHVDKKVDISESIPRIFYNRPNKYDSIPDSKVGANRTQNKTQFSSVILPKSLPLVILYLTNILID